MLSSAVHLLVPATGASRNFSGLLGSDIKRIAELANDGTASAYQKTRNWPEPELARPDTVAH